MQAFSPLTPGQVHVWYVLMDASPPELDRSIAMLSDDERVRLERFKFPHLKQSYAISHAALRLLAAHYMECHPRDVLFTTRPSGKPEFANGGALRFNMSHSGQLAAYAFALYSELGIDIETIRPLGDWSDAIARQFFQPSDSSLSFFRCWTRKEAHVKALGTGLASTLDAADGDRRWTVCDLEPGLPGYAGALVHEGEMSVVNANSPFTIEELRLLSRRCP